jgi:hypothetical protein
MVGTPVMGCFQTAFGTNSGVFIQRFGFGLYPGDEKHMDITYINDPLFSQ